MRSRVLIFTVISVRPDIIIRRKVINREALANIFSSLPSESESERKREVRKLVKDTIEAYYRKRLEAEAAASANAKKYDWEALEYR